MINRPTVPFKRLAVLLCLLPIGMVAQEENSLLWEISGNGLRQNSYLYGTMHVSKRIAFRLDDVFYEALDQSEIIALESDPGSWLSQDDNLGLTGYGQGTGFHPKGFYSHSFTVRNPRKEEIGRVLAFEDRRVNNILYRTNEHSQNFEEETYLDMFIYQAGKKFGKKVVALEDLEESTALVGKASMNAMKERPDEWLQKRMRQQDPMGMLQDAYRDRNISLLDSIDKAMYTAHYLKHMLFIRNRNMADALDSIMRDSKVFAGIGAAHLPGEEGVISKLRRKGYTVRPLISGATSKGRQLKEKFEQTIREPVYTTERPDDDLFSLSLPNRLFPVSEHISTTYISPDLANGGYVMVNRIPTFGYLKKEAVYTVEAIDRLLFENIPGSILEKTRIDRDGFPGLDIRNQLKNGDHQRYQIYLTPLEILIFKMGGEGDYVTQHSDTIFNSIRFRRSERRFLHLDSGQGDFEIRMPSLHTFPNKYRQGDRWLQGHDSLTGDYYFLRKVTLNDFTFIEEDTFELRQIQKRFYQDLGLKPVYEDFKERSLLSKAPLENKILHLKTVLRLGDYYLLGALTTADDSADAFFDSFETSRISPPNTVERIRDTALFFTTISPVRPPKFVENSALYRVGRELPKSYGAYTKKSIYQNKANEAITVELNKAHDYLMFPHIDSVWALRKKRSTENRFILVGEKDSTIGPDYHQLEFMLLDTASTRAIWVKNVVKGGLLYELRAQCDTVLGASPFAQDFFAHFQPMDTVIGKNILADKTPEFFADLRANDSIVLQGYHFLKFQNKHLDSLKHYISEFPYPEDKRHIQSYLIQSLGNLDHPEVMPFLKRTYLRSYDQSHLQTKILQAITKRGDQASTEALAELLAMDLPLVSDSFEIFKIFKPYRDSLRLAKKLYPELLDYSGISEYKGPILSILADLKEKGLIQPKRYRKYRKQLLNDAKLQLKRYNGHSKNQTGTFVNQSQAHHAGLLESYAILLHPFRSDKETARFFERLQRVDDRKVQTTYALLMMENDEGIPTDFLNSLATDINSRLMLYQKLAKADKLPLMPKEFRTQRALAESLLFEGQEYEQAVDSVVFLEQRPLRFRGKEYIGFYFKTLDGSDYDPSFTMRLIVYEKEEGKAPKTFYMNDGLRIEVTDTDAQAIELVTEEFYLKDRKRAEVYRPNMYGSFGYHGY